MVSELQAWSNDAQHVMLTGAFETSAQWCTEYRQVYTMCMQNDTYEFSRLIAMYASRQAKHNDATAISFFDSAAGIQPVSTDVNEDLSNMLQLTKACPCMHSSVPSIK